jgi:hypothetical protein
METFSQKVINHFFQEFYDTRVGIMYNLGKEHKVRLDLSMLLFWFSVIDFYGGIYYVGLKRETLKYKDGKTLKFTNSQTFENFILDFFPDPEKEYGRFIYKVFRSGVVHQMSPKSSGIIWDESEKRLIWTVTENDCKVAMLNVYKFQEMAYQSYIAYKKQILNGKLEEEHCKNICDLLINDDVLGDRENFEKECTRLKVKIGKDF